MRTFREFLPSHCRRGSGDVISMENSLWPSSWRRSGRSPPRPLRSFERVIPPPEIPRIFAPGVITLNSVQFGDFILFLYDDCVKEVFVSARYPV
jgi:hypothetical protein